MKVKLITTCMLIFMSMIFSVEKLSAEETASALVDEVLASGNKLVESYQPSSGVQTGNAFSRLYFDVFESKGLEFVISQHSQSMLLEIESSFSGLIGLSMANKPQGEVAAAWAQLSKRLTSASALPVVGPGEVSWQASFVSSLILVLREGVEALLVIALLLSYMRASGVADYQWVVKLGIGLAIVASVGVAVLLQLVFTSQTARQRELLEGVTLLVASGLMVYVSHWLLSRKDAEKWQGFIKDALHQAVDGKKLWVLGSVAFFTGSAVLLYVLAVSFAGKGILEMQLAGWVTSTLVVGVPTVTWIGIFPTLESILLQTLLLSLIPLGYFWSKRVVQ